MLESAKVLTFFPVAAHTFVYNTGAVFLKGKLQESLSDHLGDSCALVLAKKLITELNDVVTKRILNYFINAEGHFINKFLFRSTGQLFHFLCRIILLKVRNKFHHVFNYTHSILIKGKL